MLIIFDLDDTLIDTTKRLTPIILKNTLKIIIEEGLKIDDVNAAYKKLLEIDKNSSGSKQSVKKFLNDIDADKKFYDIAYDAMYEPLDDSVKVFTTKHAKKILKDLSKNHTLALVSRGNEKLQLNKLQKAGIDSGVFSKIIITTKKNKGSCYKRILKELKASCQATYVCGDNIAVDLIPAKKMGCTTIHMKWGRGRLFCDDDTVDYTINILDEIKEIIDQKNKERKYDFK